MPRIWEWETTENRPKQTTISPGKRAYIHEWSNFRLVGYESDAAFSKAFKRVVGTNPGEYLKRGFEGHGNAGMAEDF